MDDFSFWWYIIAAVIYFLTRGKKKKEQPNERPGSENNPPTNKPKSFEDLLKEITEGRPEEEPIIQQEPVVIDTRESEKESQSLEGERRVFADDESRKVYEESIKMAEGADIEFAPDENFQEPRLFKGTDKDEEEEEWSIADEIRDGLNSEEAKKAVIYSEILTRKY
ncbi:hypothetical protein [Ekhidna sp. To15]|uniref:hypothetical protein n=1 Tax=Ekhidna sp. To15 TaxID=3395267 RepID=UPI003F52058E